MHFVGTTYRSELDAATWRKSTRSGGGNNCVEVALLSTGVGVRDSKNRQGPVFLFDSTAWRSFLHGVRGGGFDAR